MLRVLAWTVWVILFISAIYLNVFKLPFRLTMTKGQMVVSHIQSHGKTNAMRSYAVGTVEGRDKPVHLSVSGLMEKTTEFGSKEVFKDKYVNTGLPLDVVVGTMWMASYDVAFPDIEPSKYSITELLATDAILLLFLVGLYLYLRSTAPPLPPEPSDFQQPGGF